MSSAVRMPIKPPLGQERERRTSTVRKTFQPFQLNNRGRSCTRGPAIRTWCVSPRISASGGDTIIFDVECPSVGTPDQRHGRHEQQAQVVSGQRVTRVTRVAY